MKKQFLFLVLILFSAQICAMEEVEVLDVKESEIHPLTKGEKLAWQLVMYYCFDEKDYESIGLIIRAVINPATFFVGKIYNGPLLENDAHNKIGEISYILYKIAHETDNEQLKRQLRERKCLPHAFTYATIKRDNSLVAAIGGESDFMAQYKIHIKANFAKMNSKRIQEGKEPLDVEGFKQLHHITGSIVGLE